VRQFILAVVIIVVVGYLDDVTLSGLRKHLRASPPAELFPCSLE
jgi:hypothetical protein